MICNFSPVAFSIFGLPIRWYALAYIFGILAALKLTEFLARKTHAQIKNEVFEEFIGNIVIGVIIGGRLGHVLFYESDFYFSNPLEILKIWKGGMSFFGGFLGIIAVSFYFCKKHKLDLLKFMDLWSVGVPIGLFFGRIANFVNGELLGMPSSEISWAVIFQDRTPRHPSQIYEAVSEGILLFLLMLFAFRKNQYEMRGRLSGIFCVGYGIARFFCEFFREPDSVFSFRLYFHTGLNLNQYFSTALILFGCYLWYRSARRLDATRE